MRCLGKLAGIGLVLVLLAGCHRPSAAQDRWAGLVAPEVLAEAGLAYYWKCPLPLEAEEKVSRVWRLDENVYALTSKNRLVAVDAVQGRYKWSYPVAGPAQTVFAPCHADAVMLPEGSGIASLQSTPDLTGAKAFRGVMINTLGYVLLLDRDTGKRVRKLDLKFAANSPGSSNGAYFFVGSVKGWYYAVRLSEGLSQWTMATGDTISVRPVFFDRRLYVASQDGKLYVVEPQLQTNRRVWLQSTDGPITGDMVVDRRGCFVPSQDYKLYAYDQLTGDQLWTFRAQGPLRQAVQVGVNSAFQWADKDRFYALDLATGRKRWDLPAGRLVLAAVKPHVFVLTSDRQLLMVHESLGKAELSLPMTGLELFLPNAAKPIIFAGNADGALVCIRPTSAEKLTEKMLKD